MRKTKLNLESPAKVCLKCGSIKKDVKSYYCQDCKTELLKQKLNE